MAHNTQEIEDMLVNDAEDIINVKKQVIPQEGEYKAKKSKKSDLIYCQKDKLCIVGTAETMPMTPFDDPTFEIWSIAQATTYPAFKRADLLFEMHNPSYWDRPEIVERMNRFGGPTYMMEHSDKVPKSVRFPVDVLLENYRRYHTTSITYMLAWALHSYLTTGKPYHVALFGIHMASREEYTEQRPCCEYWLGRLESAGVDVFMAPGGSVLTSNGLYGYEGYHPMIPRLRDRLNGLQAGVSHCGEELHHWEVQKAKNEGAVNECEYWMRQYQLGAVPVGVGG